MQFATLISALFEPMVVLLGLTLLAGWHSGLRAYAFSEYCAYFISIACVVAVARVLMARAEHTNWDISNRKKRIVPLVALIGISLANVAALAFLWHATALTWFGIMWVVWVIGFLLITLKTKISGHLSILTLAVGLLLGWYGAGTIPLLALIPLVAWSRVTLKRHTIGEVVGGIVYAVCILMVFRFLLQY